MSKPENLRGITKSASSLYAVLTEPAADRLRIGEVEFESLSEEREDLNFHFIDGSSELIQIKKRAGEYLWTAGNIRAVLTRFADRSSRTSCRFVSDARLD